MITNPDNFLHSLCKELVARAAALSPTLALVYDLDEGESGLANLHRNRAVEGEHCDNLYTVLRNYGGPAMSNDPLPRMSVQVETIGPAVEAITRAQQIFELLLNADRTPWRMVQFNGYKAADDTSDGVWRVVAIDMLQRPGSIGTQDDGRDQVIFNMDMGYVKLS